LWGSTKADMLGDDGPGGITLGVAETMAVSSLAHRCATDSKVRLLIVIGIGFRLLSCTTL